MQTPMVQLGEKESNAPIQQIVNDFSLTVATANGTGSQTSNLVILRTLFNIGIPVTGKNPLPKQHSRHADLVQPFVCPRMVILPGREGNEVLVCMNPATAAEDMSKMKPGSIIIHDDAITPAAIGEGISYHALPVKENRKVLRCTHTSALLRGQHDICGSNCLAHRNANG